MANLTIAVDGDLLKRARVRAAQLGTSVNAVLRDYMSSWVGEKDKRARAVTSLLNRASRAKSARAGRKWSREELHER
jgi:plasmid stability protein